MILGSGRRRKAEESKYKTGQHMSVVSIQASHRCTPTTQELLPPELQQQRIPSAGCCIMCMPDVVLPAAGMRSAELCAGETRAELLHVAELRTVELRATSLCAAKL